MTPETLFILYTAILGLLIGSFLNVCIYRLPRELSIVRPRSYCPRCDTAVAWYDNIPVLSFLYLKGRCRHCHESISIRYPIVELLTAVLSVALWIHFDDPLSYGLYFFLLGAPFIALTFIDLEHYLIPDLISLPGIGAGLLTTLFLGAGTIMDRLQFSLLGILIGGGLLYGLAWGYEKLRKREGLGGGDIKLVAMIGAFFGWQGAMVTLMLSSFLGTIGGIVFLLIAGKKSDYPIPFGPFLVVGSLIYLFYGESLMREYLMMTQRIILP